MIKIKYEIIIDNMSMTSTACRHEINIDPSNDVSMLKNTVSIIENIPTYAMSKIVYNGTLLEPENTFNSYDVEEGSVIYFIGTTEPPPLEYDSEDELEDDLKVEFEHLIKRLRQRFFKN